LFWKIKPDVLVEQHSVIFTMVDGRWRTRKVTRSFLKKLFWNSWQLVQCGTF